MLHAENMALRALNASMRHVSEEWVHKGTGEGVHRGTRSLTVAVESGSERIRRIVNKKLAQEDILRCAQNAQVFPRPLL